MSNIKLSEFVVEFAEYPGDFVIHAYVRGKSLCNMVEVPLGVEPVLKPALDKRVCVDCLYKASYVILANRLMEILSYFKADEGILVDVETQLPSAPPFHESPSEELKEELAELDTEVLANPEVAGEVIGNPNVVDPYPGSLERYKAANGKSSRKTVPHSSPD